VATTRATHDIRLADVPKELSDSLFVLGWHFLDLIDF
jgi:hypothetical protein